MTPEQHEIAKLRADLIAHRLLLQWFADLCFQMTKLTSDEAIFRAGLAVKIREKRAEYAAMTLPDRDAAESDLATALFQEAFLAAANHILKRAGLPPMT